jgi:hypothetical protein
MKFIEDVCEKIVSPPKLRYSPYDMGTITTIIGPAINNFGKRLDFLSVNNKGLKIQASFYENKKPV